ncbi:hypothetical protein HU200_053924 [Digitaria exilis]|uniref:Uncharacterized protein n=1 Tax=Digitaria exilis TaxID=1010633 RepID=A0A835AGF2_9POAL|nr:hypothetical protein HU200_053924 [Digitaria exilis]
MAEILAGTLTAAVVNLAKDKLTSAIAGQANLLWNFGDDLEDMNSVLESISAALHEAEKRSPKERRVQLWLKRLKHTATDISDILEDYQDTSERLTAKKPGILSCLPVAHKRIAVANRMKSITEDLRKINKDFQDFNFSVGGSGTSEQHNDVRETSSDLPEKPIISRHREKQEIINLLSARNNNDETIIVGIHGLGGMGKSTLAQLVYNDQFKNYDHPVWVYVSQDFNLKRIGNYIISQISTEEGQQNRDTLEAINRCLKNLLLDKKILIILDDLWEDKDTELERLKTMLQVGKKGTMIDVIVTTRNEHIARNLSTCKPYELQPLKDETCWEIIKRYSEFEDQPNKKRLEEIGLDIAKKCGGVPLAAQALGYMLRSKDLDVWTETNNSDIWNESSEDNGGVLPSLKLSYERMQPQLRMCFSYCAIFPKGHNIAADDLIYQWIALDFINKPSKGKEYIRQLLGMSFLQVSNLPKNSEDHMAAQYTMHDLVHDLATLIMGDELIVSYDASKSKNAHSHKYCRYVLATRYDKASKLSNVLPSKVRALHFSVSDELDLYRGAFSFAKCLRILDFSGCSSILLPASIGQLKQLKYLFAPRMKNEDLPEYITELSKLQYLNINGSSRISGLPESIGKLTSLKYLGLLGCSGISTLPESIGDLKCMVHLDMSGCSGITELPNSLGNLTNLQRLNLSGCSSLKVIPESLCGLTQIQYLDLSFCWYMTRLPESIGSMVNLEYLDMSRCGVRELPGSFKRLCNLLHLRLGWSSVKKGLPGALCGLTALQYLYMQCCQLDKMEMKDDLPFAMRNLTNLKVLDLSFNIKLYELFGVEKSGSVDFIGTLTCLEHMNLSYSKFKYLPESIGNLKRLHTLDLERCTELKMLPESIRDATGLKSLQMGGCSHELIDQANSLLPYSLTLPLFRVSADDVSARSNLHLLESENVAELHIVSLENVRSVEEAETLKLLTKRNLLCLKLAWTQGVDRLVEDKDLLGQLVPPLGLEDLYLDGYSSPSFPSWLMAISHHLPNLICIDLRNLPECRNLPPLGQLPYLESLSLRDLPGITKIDWGICGGRVFPRLSTFTLSSMEGLEEWNTTYPGEDAVESFMFPMLDKLNVTSCPRLRLKPCPPKCDVYEIFHSDKVISSLEEIQTSSHHCNSTSTSTILSIWNSQHHSFRLFHHFPALKHLSIWDCPNLTSLPEGIQQLSSLQSLSLDNCDRISELPEWLSDISSLETLYITGCRSIKSLPHCIQQLTNFRQLVIKGNQELQQWCESEENKAKLAHINIVSSRPDGI